MSKFNFDEIIDRKDTGAIKVDGLKERYGREDLIPMWIADMDFLSPPEVTEAIIERAKHGIFGYTRASQGYYDAILNWLKHYHRWEIEQDWMSFIPGVVKGIAFVIDCFLAKDEKVAILPPVYPPFRHIPELHRREILESPLKLEDGRYYIDFDDLEKTLSDEKCKLLIFCNPHNPGGRIWTKDELERIADICHRQGVLVISDEIHADLALNGNVHIPFASVSKEAQMNSITLMAPSKTFNIAGIISSFSVIPNEEIRGKFNCYLQCAELDTAHVFACVATEAAYKYGEDWLKEVKEYIWENIQFTDKYLKEHIPQLKAMIPEASFLIWLDCRDLGLRQDELNDLFVNEARLALNDGTTFGLGGDGFMRLNVGCPRSILIEALDNLKNAIDKNKKVDNLFNVLNENSNLYQQQ